LFRLAALSRLCAEIGNMSGTWREEMNIRGVTKLGTILAPKDIEFFIHNLKQKKSDDICEVWNPSAA
jgi:hypothetical protein